MNHVHKHLLIRRVFTPKKFKKRTGRLSGGEFNVFDNIPDLNLKLLTIALQEYGNKEIPGQEANPEIIKYFVESGFSINSDEISYCSAFMNWVAMKANAERSYSLVAQSWLNIGIEITHPLPGDLVVFWRESPASWKGHVALYISAVNDKIYGLGANQDDMVCIKGYSPKKVKGYRRLRYEDIKLYPETEK